MQVKKIITWFIFVLEIRISLLDSTSFVLSYTSAASFDAFTRIVAAETDIAKANTPVPWPNSNTHVNVRTLESDLVGVD